MDGKAQDLLKNVTEIAGGESSISKDKTGIETLEEYILPGMNNSKGVLASVYKWQPNQKRGPIGKLKNKILLKLKNVILNVTERQAMQQQKFNELTYKAIVELTEEMKKQSLPAGEAGSKIKDKR